MSISIQQDGWDGRQILVPVISSKENMILEFSCPQDGSGDRSFQRFQAVII
jgi:hypothetical protein